MPIPIDTWGDARRHACEVRWIANLPTSQQRREYLDAIEKRRGQAAADRLRNDLRVLWAQRKRPDPHLS